MAVVRASLVFENSEVNIFLRLLDPDADEVPATEEVSAIILVQIPVMPIHLFKPTKKPYFDDPREQAPEADTLHWLSVRRILVSADNAVNVFTTVAVWRSELW